MARARDKDYEKRVRSLAEDEPSSDSESGLDIIKSTRKGLDISHHIEALTQSQPAEVGEETEEVESDDDPPTKSKGKSRTRADTSEEESSDQESELDWSDDDPEAAYRRFKERKTLKRKRVAAETNRIRSAKKSRVAAATSIIGRKPIKKAKADDRILTGSGDGGENDTYLDDPIPEYVDSRRRKLKKLQDAGLKYPPCYDDLDFPSAAREERPAFGKDMKAQREKRDIELRTSGGIIPAPIAQWLRDYQVEGVRFLHERFVQQTGAILGDDMGLGKTIQVIAFLTAAFGKNATSQDAQRMRKVRRADDNRWYPRILIVCPGTLMRNWEDELEKWGYWQVYKFHGAPRDRTSALEAARTGMVEILITTYQTYRNNEGMVNTIEWDCVIADECHTIKSKNAEITKAMNKINALCRVGLTGTAIQNKYEELWNLLNWARPGSYGSYQEWKQMVGNPLKLGQAHDATVAQLAAARGKAKDLVETILPDVFLRRMKTLIAHQLPKKSDRVVFCQLTTTQANAYQTLLDSDKYDYLRRALDPCDCLSGKTRGWCCYQTLPNGARWGDYVFPCMMTMQKLANHLALLLPISTDLSEKQAKDLENLQTACPDNWKDLYRIRDSIINQSQREFCGKWKVLKRLLDFWHANGDKVLVFSHSVRLLRLLKSLFDIDGTKYNFSYLDGSMKYEERAQAVADFNANPNQFVFLISTKAGGVGLNITSANKVVVMDPNWNPAYDLQAQDRAYRIGQTRDVEVFRLISSGTMEEIVYARQIYKQQQANIGYTASDERRYFKGVMDMPGKKGEVFGLQNLFNFNEDGLLLSDILHKTNVAETKAGVKALDFKLDMNDDIDSDSDIEDLLSNEALGLADDDAESANSQMKKYAEFIASGGKKKGGRKGADPINAILAKAGVQYTHENSEVVGPSKTERELSRRAWENRNDIELSTMKVFQGSQSQSQSQRVSTGQTAIYSEGEDGEGEDGEDEGDDVRVVAEGLSSKDEFKINYRYRPEEKVRRRQFCEMARWMGYEDPVEFALFVEESTQEGRRRMLERFYRARRREVVGELKGRE
ncbi:hypothetical protein P154DRAFT_559389 [Amniculicola lignicola CBS 123094]|uniref:Uncharacterized protein n=1 Tax=Amniculicola lignicola CBS 123094 TaxID=1392246 RepID=A0A6A5X0X9_9PLEO|nr:hypothetical protein P154DRAFT_559389 [Amniculicola lignicola CBS 123094]